MSEKTRNILLYAGVTIGILLTLFGALHTDDTRNDSDGQIEDIIAVVDGKVISRAQFLSQHSGNESGEGSGEVTRQQIDKFLAEQIIINRAISSGIIERDKGLRSAILDAMREFVVSADPVAEPDEAALRARYDATKTEYAPPPRYQIRYRLLEDGAGQEDTLVDIEPTRFLPAGILRRSIGRTAAEALPSMTVGDQGSFDLENGRLVIILDGVREGSVPDFEAIRSRILEDWYRLEEERRYAAYLRKLIEDADVDYLDGGQD